MCPKKALNSVTFVEAGACWIACIFDDDGCSPLLSIMWPKYSTEVVAKIHLECFNVIPADESRDNTSSRLHR